MECNLNNAAQVKNIHTNLTKGTAKSNASLLSSIRSQLNGEFLDVVREELGTSSARTVAEISTSQARACVRIVSR